MIIGKVVGSVVSTRKNENLVGSKFMIVEPIPSLRVDMLLHRVMGSNPRTSPSVRLCLRLGVEWLAQLAVE